jgi:hypothetical protein
MTPQYARLVSEWIGSIGLDPRLFGTHSLRRTKATLIYRRTSNLRAGGLSDASVEAKSRLHKIEKERANPGSFHRLVCAELTSILIAGS